MAPPGLLGRFLALSLLLLASLSAGENSSIITDDTFFYGQSPPVYPSPPMSGNGMTGAFEKAQAFVARLTLEEKVVLTSGATQRWGCSGAIGPIERVGFPGMCFSGSGNGIGGGELTNAYPSGIHVGASWNQNLTARRGSAMGAEFRRKGINVLLGPVASPAWRVVRGGRNWEGFSADPYLSGVLMSASVTGIQSEGVMTSVKHFILNEQETYRAPFGEMESVSSNVDDKTMHEVYLWPFQDAVKAGAANIMCSYQRINNSHGCANSKTLNGLLKEELGFQGFVVSDWDAQYNGVASALAGLDMAMPNGSKFWGENLVRSIQNGSVPESRLTDMATRIMTTWYQYGQDTLFPNPGIGLPQDSMVPHTAVEGRDRSALPILSQGAVEGHVLVKNTRNALPLKSPRVLSLFGYSAKSPDLWAPGPGLEGASWPLGTESINVLELLLNVADPDPSRNFSAFGINGTLIGAGGSGANSAAVFSSPFQSITTRALRDDTAIFHDFVSGEPSVSPISDACIVFANAWACESYDRPSLSDEYTDTLVRTVASQCNNTIVVMHNAGVRTVDGFVDHPNVTSIIFAHLPGRDSGDALVALLYGDENPSGKLPYTVAKREADYGHLLDPSLGSGRYQRFPQSDFSEGQFLDYKYFDKNGIQPRYEFGFGLSYTSFAFSDIKIERSPDAYTAVLPRGQITVGGQSDLWDVVATVEATVQNIGQVAGAEVTQLYVGIPGGPVKQLRGFEKEFFQPKQSRRIVFHLTRRDLSTWDTTAQKWKLQGGRYVMQVGNSSRNLPLRGYLDL